MRYSQKYLNENKEQLDEFRRFLPGLIKWFKDLGKKLGGRGAAGTAAGTAAGAAAGTAAAQVAGKALEAGLGVAKSATKAALTPAVQRALEQAKAHSGGNTTHTRGAEALAGFLGDIKGRADRATTARTQERRHRERVGAADRSRRS